MGPEPKLEFWERAFLTALPAIVRANEGAGGADNITAEAGRYAGAAVTEREKFRKALGKDINR